ncbi:hypothetical protein [Fortiea sp. LEGE XX443]
MTNPSTVIFTAWMKFLRTNFCLLLQILNTGTKAWYVLPVI